MVKFITKNGGEYTVLPMILVRSQIKNMLSGETGKIPWEE